MTTKIKDSGGRRKFSTGAHRDMSFGKGRYDLISPIFLSRLAIHLEGGAKKYEDRNWEKGMPLLVYLDSTLRHLEQQLEGDREEDHMAAAAFNVMCFIHTEEMVKRELLSKELDNLPNYIKKKKK